MADATFIPSRPSDRFTRFFGNYTRRLFAKKFHAVRLAAGTREALATLDTHEAPVLAVLNHASWWDPLTSLLVSRELTPRRANAAPMEAAMLRKFSFFRYLGIFGIDPDTPASLDAMARHVADRFRDRPATTLWITAQGKFEDVRTPIRIRPGAAALAAQHPGIRVVTLAIEYGFWIDQKPEVFLRLATIDPPPTTEGRAISTTAWYRAIQGGMQANQDALSALVRAREPAAFEPLIGGRSGVHPLYDLYLRLRGKSASLDAPRAASSGGGTA